MKFLIKIFFKIYKNVFNLFINEPTKLQNIPAIEFNLTFDLGTYITSNKNKLNYYVGNDIKSEIYIKVILSILKREHDFTVNVFHYSLQSFLARTSISLSVWWAFLSVSRQTSNKNGYENGQKNWPVRNVRKIMFTAGHAYVLKLIEALYFFFSIVTFICY